MKTYQKKRVDNLTPKQLDRQLTAEQREFIEMVKRGRVDPVQFASECLGIKLHDGQKVWLWMTTKTRPDLALEAATRLGVLRENMKELKMPDAASAFEAVREMNPDMSRNILVPSNRWGKTFVTTVKHLWYCYYKKGVRGTPRHIASTRCGTLNLSPHSKQCDAGYQYVLDILSSQLVYVVDGASYKNECRIGEFFKSASVQKREITFANGTTYRAVPTGEDQASSLAGTPYLYISYDECAQSLHLKEELPAKVMSRLIDFGGPLDLVSTPEVDKPSHQYFSHVAKLGLKGEEGWFTMVGKITDNNFLGAAERDRTLASIKATDPAKYRQVAFGDFVTTGKKMFDTLLVERLWDGHSMPPVMHEHKYLLVADWGFADTGDPTVFYVIDYTDAAKWSALPPASRPARMPRYRVAFRESIRGGSPFAVLARARMLQRDWNGAKFIHDASALGGTIIKKMLKEMEMHDLIDFSASGGNKMDMLFCLLVVLSDGRRVTVDEEGKVIDENPDFGRLRSFYIPELESQAGNYQYNPDKGVSDRKIEQDDIMALGMGTWWLERKVVKAKITKIEFNPLADTLDKVFAPVANGEQITVRDLAIPEKRIF